MRGGLENAGRNICYANSAVQCLASSSVFFTTLERHLIYAPLHSAALARTLYSILCEVRSGIATNLDPLISALCETEQGAPFAGQRQHDAHEFLLTLLDLLGPAISGCMLSILPFSIRCEFCFNNGSNKSAVSDVDAIVERKETFTNLSLDLLSWYTQQERQKMAIKQGNVSTTTTTTTTTTKEWQTYHLMVHAFAASQNVPVLINVAVTELAEKDSLTNIIPTVFVHDVLTTVEKNMGWKYSVAICCCFSDIVRVFHRTDSFWMLKNSWEQTEDAKLVYQEAGGHLQQFGICVYEMPPTNNYLAQTSVTTSYTSVKSPAWLHWWICHSTGETEDCLGWPTLFANPFPCSFAALEHEDKNDVIDMISSFLRKQVSTLLCTSQVQLHTYEVKSTTVLQCTDRHGIVRSTIHSKNQNHGNVFSEDVEILRVHWSHANLNEYFSIRQCLKEYVEKLGAGLLQTSNHRNLMVPSAQQFASSSVSFLDIKSRGHAPPMQQQLIPTFQQILDAYFCTERLEEWKCEHCAQKNGGIKTLNISTATFPPLLCLHIKRFVYDAALGERKKLRFPLNISSAMWCSIGGFSSQFPFTSPRHQYRLVAVLCHNGSAYGGHYTAMCRIHTLQGERENDDNDSNKTMENESGDAFVYCSDESVQSMQGNERALLEAGSRDTSSYLLFYEFIKSN
jgi:ubiquitin C-terminal hydrolase